MSYADIVGGAAIAAYRQHRGLLASGCNSRMYAGIKLSDDASVLSGCSKLSRAWPHLTPTIDSLPLLCYKQRNKSFFSTGLITNVYKKRQNDQDGPELFNLHWICSGYLGIEKLSRLGRPIVWTLHDMWPFTGGCHYDEGCGRYKDSCGRCPQLGSHKQNDLSHLIWKKKNRVWNGLNITVVTPSRWLANCARDSALFRDFRIEIMPNGLDTNVYKLIDKRLARDILNLPQGKKLILFGALQATSDKRKGFQILAPALELLSKTTQQQETELVVFGSSVSVNGPDFSLKTHYLGRVHDDVSLALIYSAADVFVAPSVQDNLPNTVMESLSCGTPAVAFNIGGMPDMIEHMSNGWLARPYEAEDLAEGIAWVLGDADRHRALSARAREKVMEEFDIKKNSKRYECLYHEIINERRSNAG